MPTRSATTTPHPLDRLSAEEIARARTILHEAGFLPDTTRVVYLDDRSEALYGPERPARLVRVLLHDPAVHGGRDIIVSLTTESVLRATVLDPAADGQLPVLDQEFGLVEQILAGDERWLR